MFERAAINLSNDLKQIFGILVFYMVSDSIVICSASWNEQLIPSFSAINLAWKHFYFKLNVLIL